MIICDIFRCNDWNIRRFNIFILSLLIAYDFSFISSLFLYNFEILPQILGFLMITFVPGYIILRILKIHNIDRVVNLLLAIGLSLSFTMIFGFGFNLFLPYIGISKPISTFPLFCGLNLIILILLPICYSIDREFSSPQDKLFITFSPMLLYLFLLPILSVLGTYFMNYYNSNILIMILLFLISLVPILAIFGRTKTSLYPLMILSISISILLQMNLISMHLWSYDIFFEAYSTNQVLENGMWNPNIDSIIPLLIFTILSPIYSILCDLNIVWVFKIIFPILFSFTPLALYQIYQKIEFGEYKPDSEIAMLSVLVFVFFYGFFKDMPDKQHIAELFLALILLLVVINNSERSILLFIFSFSLITSHYGVSYLFMLSLIFMYLFNKFSSDKKNCLLTPNYILFFSILTLGWYIYISGGYEFQNIISVFKRLSGISEVFQSDLRSGLSYLNSGSNDVLWIIYKVIHIFLQFFIFIGIFNLLSTIKKNKTESFEISLISIAFYIFVLIQITKTYGMGFDRILQITLILLSPLSLWGFLTILKHLTAVYTHISSQLISSKSLEKRRPIFMHVLNAKNENNSYQKGRFCFAIFLMIFFMFNSGLVFQVAGDTLPGYCINLNNSAGWPVYSESEVYGVNWLKYHGNEQDNVAVFNKWSAIKSRDGLLVSEKYNSKKLIHIRPETTELYDAYVFIGKLSMLKVESDEKDVNLEDSIFYKNILQKSEKIYNSGKSHLYISK